MIDDRLRAIKSFVRAGNFVADIGADHGHLSLELIKSGLSRKIIATEKNVGPFEALQKNILESGFENEIEVRLGDGLKVITAGEVDTICLAGMGGALMTKILNEKPQVVQRAQQLILQPMNGIKKIRSWLIENDWKIADEDLAESRGIIYEIICAEKNPFPRTFKRETSPLREKFLVQRLKKLDKILLEMTKSESAQKTEKFLGIKIELENLKDNLFLICKTIY